ncbi:MAG: PVC-type heme-binding CxxCH protein [Planctomycetaceae bacterium]
MQKSLSMESWREFTGRFGAYTDRLRKGANYGPGKARLGAWLACALTYAAATLAADDHQSFPQPRNTQNPQDHLSTPAEALAGISLPEGFHVSLFAAEPDVQQPIAMTTDERGRLWLAENYTYAESAVGFADDLRDRIVILEDVDGDGKFDKRKVFWDQGRKLTSIEVGYGGVWALCPPHLLFIPDRDRDDVPDGPPVVLLDGWDAAKVRHNIVNGLKWGPDGWLYGRHGILATSSVGPPGAPESQRAHINCGLWRFHPSRKVFEIVAHGTTNPWGFDYDDHGEMFFINTVIGHLWHVVPGAHFKRMYGIDFNPHLYELIDQTADHFHWDTGEAWNDVRKGVSATTSQLGGGHAHSGLMIYLGDNWPARYRNTMLTINLHGRRLNNDRLVRQGAGFVGIHADDLFFVADPWFRGIELLYGPDGGVFIADWTDVGECHESDGVHRTSGRIFKVTYGDRPHPPRFDLAALGDQQLVEMQLLANDWQVRQARRVLCERALAKRDLGAARQALLKMFETHPDVTRRLRALWCLWGMGALDDEWLAKQLQDPQENVRAWAVRLLVDRGAPSGRAVEALTSLAEREQSGLVQLYLASALQRLPFERRWPIARSLATKREFAIDPVLPLMVWYGVEAAVPANPQAALALAQATAMPVVCRHLARRLTLELERRPEAVEALVESLARMDNGFYRQEVLAGVSEALRGWRSVRTPASWAGTATKLERDGSDEIRAQVRKLSVVFGDARAIGSLRQIAGDAKADVKSRREALRTLVDARTDDLLSLLKKLIGDPALAGEAIRGLADYNAPETPHEVLDAYPRLDPAGRAAAIDTLATRPAYAIALLEAVDSGRVPRNDVTAYHARQMQGLQSPQLTALLTRVWGATRATDAEKRKLIAQYRDKLTSEWLAKGDLSAGRGVFQKLCANCHVLYGQGKSIGPDLTGSNRKNLEYLLENLIDPSAQVASNFRVAMVVLESGRVVTGVVVEEAERTLTLQTQDERVTIDRREIDEQSDTAQSLMPEGQLATLSDEQVRNLIAYLMATEQVPLPAESP